MNLDEIKQLADEAYSLCDRLERELTDLNTKYQGSQHFKMKAAYRKAKERLLRRMDKEFELTAI